MFKRFLKFLHELHKQILKDNLSALSAELTYFLLLSFFPFMMFLLTILSYTPITQTEMIDRIGNVFPDNIRIIIVSILNEIATKRNNALLSVSVLVMLWSASRGVSALIKGLNIAYNLNETRSFLFLKLTSLIYTIVFAIVIIISFILLIFGKQLLSWSAIQFSIPINILEKIQLIRFVIPFLFLFVFFIIIYNAIPNRKVSIKEVIPGATFSTIFWVIVSISFSYYINNFTKFSYMYGSLTGIIVLLLWLYINSNIIMIGGEINALLVAKKVNEY